MSLDPAEEQHESKEKLDSHHKIATRRIDLIDCPPGHPERARACTDLAFSLWEHYNRFSDQGLLAEAIDLLGKALALCPHGHPSHAQSCQNLAVSLHTHYQHTGDQQLLIKAIDLGRKALALCPPSHPDHALSCQNLASSLHKRYEYTGDQQLLTEVIDLERKALALCPQGNPRHVVSCRNLAVSLHKQYRHTGDQQLLAQAVDLYQQCSLLDVENTQWRSFMGLADIYLEGGAAIYNIDKSIELLLAGIANKDNDSVTELVRWAVLTLNNMWQCKEIYRLQHSSLSQVYQRLSMILPLLAHPVLDAHGQLHALKHFSHIGPDAFINAVLGGDGKSGIEMLELMQGLVWSQRLRYHDPQLDEVPVHLANRLKTSLEMLSHNRPSLPSKSNPLPSAPVLRDVLHNQSVHVQTLVHEIRALPGLHRFMLGESFDALCAVASEYPVVVLVNARGHSYALIFTAHSDTWPARDEDRCSMLRLDVTAQEISGFTISQAYTRHGRGSERSHGINHHPGGRAFGIDRPSKGWIRRLKTMWEKIVQPVLDHLRLQVRR
jgi:tetratricopeptide (TPR) repeat protein